MYILFSIIFIFICITLISLIIFSPSKNNILESYTNYKNNNKTIITSNLIKSTINKIIINLIILFYIISIILNLINNKKINKIKNKINNIKILSNYKLK